MDSTILEGSLGSLTAGLCTSLGALWIFLRRRWSETAQIVMLAVAAGVMLGATVFSLVLPAIGLVTDRTGSPLQGVLVAGGGILLGALGIQLLHACVPHEHFTKGAEGPLHSGLGRHWLFIIAITLHNFPEGASVGVAYGAGHATGLAVTLGIGLQNIPEGLAVAVALLASGATRWHAFKIATWTGLVEPVGGILGATFATLGDTVLPWGLAGAGGAMLFVVSGEVIPETHRSGRERSATFALVLGFVVMMILDVALG